MKGENLNLKKGLILYINCLQRWYHLPWIHGSIYFAEDMKKKALNALAAGDFKPKCYDLKTPGLIKTYIVDNQRRIFIKQSIL